jgi:hypothetical protein
MKNVHMIFSDVLEDQSDTQRNYDTIIYNKFN